MFITKKELEELKNRVYKLENQNANNRLNRLEEKNKEFYQVFFNTH